jgi:hypothetical protein
MKIQIAIAALATSLLAGCATSEYGVAELRDLPFGVQRTIIEQAPGGDIAKVVRRTDHNEAVYDVSFHDPLEYPTLHIAGDGTLLANGRPVILHERAGAARLIVPELVTPIVVQPSSLPVAVLNAIRAQAPNAEIADVDKKVRSQIVYEVQFADPSLNPTLHISEDGTVIDTK